MSAICQHTTIESAYVAVLVEESAKADLEAVEDLSLAEFVDTPPVDPDQVVAEEAEKGEEEEEEKANGDDEATEQVSFESEKPSSFFLYIYIVFKSSIKG